MYKGEMKRVSWKHTLYFCTTPRYSSKSNRGSTTVVDPPGQNNKVRFENIKNTCSNTMANFDVF